MINTYSINSRSDISFSLGLGVGLEKFGTKIASLESSFKWSDHKVKSRFIIEYYQTLFNVQMDLPTKPSDLFDPSVTFEDIKKYAGNTCPVYVSRINYGRAGYLCVESYSSETETKAALNAMLKMNGVNLNLGTAAATTNALSNATIKGFVVGGNLTSGSFAALGVNEFINWIKITNAEDIITAVPLSFNMLYLANNRQAIVYKVYDTYRLEYTGTNSGSSSSASSSATTPGSLLINSRVGGSCRYYLSGEREDCYYVDSGTVTIQLYNSNNMCFYQTSGNPAVYNYPNPKPSDVIVFVCNAICTHTWNGRGGSGSTNFSVRMVNSIRVSDILTNSASIVSGRFSTGTIGNFTNGVVNSYSIEKQ